MDKNSYNFSEAVDDLLRLASSYMYGKAVFLGRTNEETFSIIKVLDNKTECKLNDELTTGIENSY